MKKILMILSIQVFITQNSTISYASEKTKTLSTQANVQLEYCGRISSDECNKRNIQKLLAGFKSSSIVTDTLKGVETTYHVLCKDGRTKRGLFDGVLSARDVYKTKCQNDSGLSLDVKIISKEVHYDAPSATVTYELHSIQIN